MRVDASTLVIFGWSVMGASVALILVPFLMGRRHLMTARNAFLGGCIPFVGSSSIACATTQSNYGSYGSSDYLTFMVGIVCAIATMLLVYNWYRPPRLTTVFFEKEPQYSHSQPTLFAMIAVALILASYAITSGLYIPVVSEVIVKSAPPGAAFAVVFAFGSWLRHRSNPLLLVLLVIIFFLCLVIAVRSGGGRRIFLGVLGAIPTLYYWDSQNLGNRSRIRLVAVVSVLALVGFVVLTAYSEVRHFDRGRGADRSAGRTFTRSVKALAEIPNRVVHFGETITNPRFHSEFGQNAVNCSLYSIHLSKRWSGETPEGIRYPQPFHSLFFIAANPVPRRFWANKPYTLGYALPKIYRRHANVNWGPGIVGHAFHEGGYFFLFFYGALFGVILKTIDTIITHQRHNLFVLGWAAALFPQILMAARGDNSMVILNLIFATIFFLVMRRLGFMMYGRMIRRQLRMPAPVFPPPVRQ